MRRGQLILAKCEAENGRDGSRKLVSAGQQETTSEDCLALGIGEFRGHIFPTSAGTVTWTRAGTVTASIGFAVNWDTGPTLTLHYRRAEADIRIPIRLQATYPALGGRRWWFTCPLSVNGRECNRRAGKLFLPPGARCFGCRGCHDLSLPKLARGTPEGTAVCVVRLSRFGMNGNLVRVVRFQQGKETGKVRLSGRTACYRSMARAGFGELFAFHADRLGPTRSTKGEIMYTPSLTEAVCGVC